MRLMIAICGCLVLCLMVCETANSADEVKPDFRSPISAEDSLPHFQLDDGLKIEIVAAEPEVIDPVAIAFGADGSLWVVEMRDYPKGPKPGEPPYSKIKRLIDSDEDGRFETATVFAENLLFPTGLLPWQDGVIVTLAGEIAFFADRDGDGKAEFKETWFTGFAQENSQLRHNHPTLGLDGSIYVANGLRGGTIVATKPEWTAKNEPVKLTGFDFRFDPHTGVSEAITGNGQFGLTFDDWGNRFVCSNRNPCQHVVLENWQLKLNPLVAVKSVMHDVAAAGENSRIYPISKFWTTSQLHAGQFTAACGVTIFRGNGLGESYYGNAFTCDPTGNLVHREVLTPDGATFSGASPYREREFLATPDTWFRPVNFAHGPDGSLYVVDMYRAVIEHPDWVPVELKNRPDERFGEDRGRIYRIVSRKHSIDRKAKDQRLKQDSISELAKMLSHPNAWQRDTAFRLLSETRSPEIIPAVFAIDKVSTSPPGRVAAIHLRNRLENRFFFERPDESEHPRVREALWKHYRSANLYQLPIDSDPSARFQEVLSLGAVTKISPAELLRSMTPVIQQGIDDPWMQTAILLNVREQGQLLLQPILAEPVDAENRNRREEFLENYGALISTRGNAEEETETLKATLYHSERVQPELIWAVIRGLAIGQQRRGNSWTKFVSIQPDEVQATLSDLAEETAQLANENAVSPAIRVSALRLLKYHVDGIAFPYLLRIATTESLSAVRQAAVESLVNYAAPEISLKLLEIFPAEPPAGRRAILDVLLANEQRTIVLLDALEEKTLSLSEVDPSRAARLTNHRNADIKQRAAKLFAAAVADRAALLEKYRPAARMDADANNGRVIFEKNCATCHRVSHIGVNVGPDVGDNYARTPEALLLSILDPNRAVDNNYFGYTIATHDGRILTGIITAETASSITLKQPEGKVEVVLRSDIDEMKGSGQSLMPVGLEKNISVDQMADLITFLKNWRYIDANVPAGTE